MRSTSQPGEPTGKTDAPDRRARRRYGILTLGCLLGLHACAPDITKRPAPEVRPFTAEPVPDPDQVARWAKAFEFHAFSARRGAIVPYRLLRPRRAERLPLVIVLHGSGAMGNDNRGQLGPFAAAWAQPAIGPAVIAVPQVQTRSADYGPGSTGSVASRPGPSFATLLELVDRLRADPAVDARRVHLVGFSMGASAALQLALVRPEGFASVTAFSPVPPDPRLAASLKRQRITLVHGDQDVENPFVASHAWIEALKAAGGQPRFVVYRGMAHRVPPDLLLSTGWRQQIVALRPAR